MRVLLVSVGTVGDTLPFVGLGQELRQRGHEVTFLGSGPFRHLADAAGIEFGELISVAEHLRETEQRRRWGNGLVAMREGLANLLRDVRTTYRAIEMRNEPGRTVLVASGLMFGARIAQEKLGIPLATMHLQPACFRGEDEPFTSSSWLGRAANAGNYWLADQVADTFLAGPINRFRAELGLPKARKIMGGWWNSPQLVLGAFPSFLAPKRERWPAEVRFAGFPLYHGVSTFDEEERLAAYLVRGESPLVFCPTSAVRDVRQFVRHSIDTADALGRRAIVLTPHVEHLPQVLPRGVEHFRFVPHERILPHAAALIHNGGIGTAAAALAAGIPQLIVPSILDQFDNARRLKHLGVAEVVRAKSYDRARCWAALNSLLANPSVAARCEHFAVACRQQRGLATMADAVESLRP